MKKLLTLLVLVLCIAGCAEESINVSESDTVLFEVNGEAYTKGELFNSLTAADYSDTVLTDMEMKIVTAEEIDTTELEEEAEEYYEYIAAYGDYYVEYYGGKDAIIDSYYSYKIIELLEEEYAHQNMDEIVENYSPFKAQFAYFDNEEDANKVIELVNNGSTFDMAALEAGYEYDTSETVYTQRDSSMNSEAKAYCMEASEPGISGVITSSSTTTDSEGNSVLTATYYVVNLVSNDVTEFEDEFVEYMIDNAYIDEDVCINYFLKRHEINIYVQEVYDTLSDTYVALEIE